MCKLILVGMDKDFVTMTALFEIHNLQKHTHTHIIAKMCCILVFSQRQQHS